MQLLDDLCFYQLYSSIFCNYPVFSKCSEIYQINIQSCRTGTKCKWLDQGWFNLHALSYISLTPKRPPDTQLKCSSPKTQLTTWWFHYQVKFCTKIQCDEELTSVPAFEDTYTHLFASFTLASQNEFAELMIFWEGVNIPGAVGSPAGGGALGKAELNPQVSQHSFSDNAEQSPALLSSRSGACSSLHSGIFGLCFLAMCQHRELHLNQVCSAAWPGWTHRHLLLSDTSSGQKVMHPGTSGDNAQQHKCAQSIHCHPAHEAAGKIKPDTACCVNGNSMEGQPWCSWIC